MIAGDKYCIAPLCKLLREGTERYLRSRRHRLLGSDPGQDQRAPRPSLHAQAGLGLSALRRGRPGGALRGRSSGRLERVMSARESRGEGGLGRAKRALLMLRGADSPRPPRAALSIQPSLKFHRQHLAKVYL